MPSNKDYWRKRAELLEAALHKQGVEYFETLEREYLKASASIEKDIAAWYQRFADNNDISMAEAKYLLSTRDLKEFRWRVEEYIEHGEENYIDGKWTKQLENASARYHVSRLESLKIDLQQKLEVLFKNQLDGFDTLLRSAYLEGYYRTAFDIQQGIGVGKKMQALSPTQLNQAISKPWSTDGKTFSDRIWRDKEKLIKNVQTELTQTIIRGDAPDTAIKNIAREMEVGKKQAGRLVMTELSHIQAEAQDKCYEDLEVDRYEVIASLDGKTCKKCGAKDGLVFKRSEFESGVTANPFHPGCRCCTAPYHKDMEGIGMRFARDPKTGKSYYVPRSMKYEEWYKEFVIDKYGEDEAEILRKMHANESADKKQYKKYKAVFGKEAPKSFADFQELKYNNTEKWNELKANKQATLNKLNYSKKLDQLFGNAEVRGWYVSHIESISDSLDTTKTLEEQAKKALELRNKYRTQARSMMMDTKSSSELNLNRPNLTLEELLSHKQQKYGLTQDDAYRDIIRSASTANKAVNKKYGME